MRSIATLATLVLAAAFARSAGVASTYAEWQKISGESVDVKTFAPASSETPRIVTSNVLKSVRWALGRASEKHGELSASVPQQVGTGPVRDLSFGDNVRGRLLFAERQERPPVIIWLGSTAGTSVLDSFTRAGFAVLTFDSIGGGTRRDELRGFYEQHPHWSLLGKMVADTSAALDVIATLGLNTNRVWLFGEAANSSVALHVAALDRRVSGVVVLDGFGPMRPALANRGVPLFAASQRSLLPRLGAFVGHEDRIPYDHRDLVQVVAPRPVLLFSRGGEVGVDPRDLVRIYEPMKHVTFQVLQSNARPEAVLDELKRAGGLR